MTALEADVARDAVRLSSRHILVATVLGSLVLSLLAAWTDDVLNSDGMWYVHTARVFVEQGTGAALETFEWPALPILIGMLQVSTGLSFVVSAYALNAALLAGLSAGFVVLYEEVGGSRAWVAAAVILLSPFLNEYRNYIIRDFGYWCFGIWAILFFVRYFQRGNRWQDAFAWQLCIFAAVAFRIEALAIGALLPLYCGFQPRGRLRAWLHLNALFLGALLALALLILLDVPVADMKRVRFLQNFFSWSVVIGDFSGKMAAVSHHLQAVPSIGDTPAFLIGGVIGIFLRQTLGGMGILLLPLAVGLWRHRACITHWGVLWWAIFATALPVLIFTLREMFLSGRYPGLPILLLSLPAAAVLDGYCPSLTDAWRKHQISVVLIVMALSFWVVDAVVVTKHNKLFLREAGEWASQHLPATARVLSNDDTVYFYLGRGYTRKARYGDNPLFAAVPGAERNDWLLLHVHRQDAPAFEAVLSRLPELQLTAHFENSKGDAVYALRIPPVAAEN